MTRIKDKVLYSYLACMFALQFKAKGTPLVKSEIPEPKPARGEVSVRLAAAAYNRRDFWIQQGLYPNVQYPVIPGGDAAGTVDGREVVIDAGIGWGTNRRVQSDGYYLIGSPGQGTFAQHICVPEENIYNKPPHLTLTEAAALPVAGVTAYRALIYRGQASPGERLLVTGAGGGVALTAVQFGLAHGMEVFVTSGSDEKITRAKELGASGGANYKGQEWEKALKSQAGGFDVIIDSAGGDGFSKLLKLCNPAARIVSYGGSLGKVNGLSPQHLFWRQISIHGTSMGSPEDFSEMLAFVEKHKIKPVIDSTYSFENANEGIDVLSKGTQFGKLILEIPG